MRLQNTIEGILNLSRLESHNAKLQMDVFPVQQLLGGVIQELQIFADRKLLQLINAMPHDPVYIRGDMEMIRLRAGLA